MTNPHLQLLFQTDLVRVEDYRCDGTEDGGEEMAYDHEIVFPRSGLFLRYDRFGKVMADVNHILFFHRHQPYQITHPVTGGECSTIFTLRPAVLSEMLAAVDPSALDRPERPFPVGSMMVGTSQYLRQWQLLHDALSGGDPLATEERLLALLGEVMCAAYQSPRFVLRLNPGKANTVRGHRELVEQTKLVLNRRFREPLKLDDVARDVYTSPFHLSRVFRHSAGLPLHQYLLRLRLFHALELLAERSAELTGIAFELGFSSHSHFTTAFRQTFGLTPSQFRQGASLSLMRELSKNLKA